MLSVKRCRELLGASAPSSDEKIEELRNQLYAVAVVWLELGARPVKTPDSASVLDGLPVELRADVEERAAIMEFDGGSDRDEAERAAMMECLSTGKCRTH